MDRRLEGERRYTPLVDEYADRYGVPQQYARALIRYESNWDPAAIGKDGEQGLGQLMSAAAIDMGLDPRKRFNPRMNVDAAMKLLSRLYETNGRDWPMALCEYNQGRRGCAGTGGRKAGLEYASDIIDRDGRRTRMGTSPAGTTPVGVSTPAKDDVAVPKNIGTTDCPGFSFIHPGDWPATLKCSFPGALLYLTTAGLVLYAAWASLN